MLDLETGDRKYYASVDALPDGGLANDIYKTTKLVMRRTRDPRKWADETLSRKRADGTATNLFAGKAFGTWQSEKSKGTLDIGADGILSAIGVTDGCFLGSVADVKPGQWYLAEFDVKGDTDPRCGIQWKRGAAYDWDVPARYPVFTPLADDGGSGRFVETSLPGNPIVSGRDAPRRVSRMAGDTPPSSYASPTTWTP